MYSICHGSRERRRRQAVVARHHPMAGHAPPRRAHRADRRPRRATQPATRRHLAHPPQPITRSDTM